MEPDWTWDGAAEFGEKEKQASQSEISLPDSLWPFTAANSERENHWGSEMEQSTGNEFQFQAIAVESKNFQIGGKWVIYKARDSWEKSGQSLVLFQKKENPAERFSIYHELQEHNCDLEGNFIFFPNNSKIKFKNLKLSKYDKYFYFK